MMHFKNWYIYAFQNTGIAVKPRFPMKSYWEISTSFLSNIGAKIRLLLHYSSVSFKEVICFNICLIYV